ncbi:hypothetical protein Mpsy_0169 [Methanolobus psychrophilus R15]|nr:hypothetical protein Mpsy_0169 [Methanolobus psychrophilus R15]
MSMYPDYTNCRFMRKDDFITFCKKNSIPIDDQRLELFEKEKLFFPVKRWLFNDEYAIFNHQKILIPPDKIVLPTVCLPLIHLEENIFEFRNLSFYAKKEHPFDETNKDWQEYLINPYASDFIEWENYVLNHIDEEGEKWRLQKSESYYSYWQIYELEAINIFRKVLLTVKYNEQENYYHLTCNKDNIEKYSKHRKEHISIFFKFEHYYNCLCEFIQYYERSRDIAFKDKKAGEALTVAEISLLNSDIFEKSNSLMRACSINAGRTSIYSFFLREEQE